jgi:EmrB/QacA subfamily drug resistance transporter
MRSEQDGATAGTRWAVLAVAGLGVFPAFLDMTIVNVAFPDLERSFLGATRAELSWVLSAYNIAFAALLVPAGRLADLIGRRRLYLTGLVVFALASALCAAAPSAATLVAARTLQAVGAAVVVPAALALVLPAFPLTERATAVGLLGAAAALASAAGPSLGGVLVELYGWRLVFLVNLPVALAALAFARSVAGESRDPARGAVPDPLGIALIACSVAALALAIVQGGEWGWGSLEILGSLATACVLGALFVRRAMRHPAPAIELTLFRERSFSVANAGSLLFATAFYAAILANVLFLTSVWDYSVLEAGLATTPAPLVGALVAGPAGRLADRFGQRAVIVPGAAIYSLGVGWFVLAVGTEPAFVPEWLPGAALTGVGVGSVFPAFASAAVAALPTARFATGSAVNATARQLGAVLGVSLLVAIVGSPAPTEAATAFDRGWVFAGLAGLASGFAALGLGRVRAHEPALGQPDRPAEGAL